MLGGSRKVKSLGKQQDDALIELSFVLPLPANEEGIKLAERYVKQHRFHKVEKIVALKLNEHYTQFVVVAASSEVLKLPHEKKHQEQPSAARAEYDQVIDRAVAGVAKPGQKTLRPRMEALPISIVQEMVEAKPAEKTEQLASPSDKKPFRSRRRGRRGGKNRKRPGQVPQGAAPASTETAVQPAVVPKTHES